jgi:chromosomal replication initiation ATPase DnaA
MGARRGIQMTAKQRRTAPIMMNTAILDRLYAKVFKVTGISKEQMHKRTRQRRHVVARAMMYSILREFFFYTYEMIGDEFDKNHATILHALKQHKIDLHNDKLYATMYNNLLIQLQMAPEPTGDMGELLKEMRDVLARRKAIVIDDYL